MTKPVKILLIVFLTVWIISLPINFVLADVGESFIPELEIKIGAGSWGSQEDFKVGYGMGDCPPNVEKDRECINIPWIGQYVSALYQYGVGLAAVLAVVMIMIGGFLWLTSGGSPNRAGKAKEFITSALLGLLLALFSYTILYTINPRLVTMGSLKVVKVAEMKQTCCEKDGEAFWQYPAGGDCKSLGEGWSDGGDECAKSEGCCRIVGFEDSISCEYIMDLDDSCQEGEEGGYGYSVTYTSYPEKHCNKVPGCPGGPPLESEDKSGCCKIVSSYGDSTGTICQEQNNLSATCKKGIYPGWQGGTMTYTPYKGKSCSEVSGCP